MLTTRFHLQRVHDISGVSGTGRVADGVIFPDGTTVIHWLGEARSTTVYECMMDAINIHGHNGSTEFIQDYGENFDGYSNYYGKLG